MMYKIELKETRKKQVEELRDVNSFNNVVFFWDCMTSGVFDSVEYAVSFAKSKMDDEDYSNIIIVKVEDSF